MAVSAGWTAGGAVAGGSTDKSRTDKTSDSLANKELPMSKPEFGTKHTCEACAERFYDLNRSPAICFKCGAQQSPPKPRMYRPLRAGSDRGAFGRRAMPIAAEKLEPADEVAVEEEVEEADLPDDDDTDLDDETEVEIEVEIDPEDGKIIA
jgi:uncharacterized protein (TIGR02300 family)